MFIGILRIPYSYVICKNKYKYAISVSLNVILYSAMEYLSRDI